MSVEWYKGGLWQKPRLIPSDTSKSVTTTELFFDLIYATAIARLGDFLRGDELNLISYCLYFLTIWFFWQTSTEYSTRFNTDDLFNKLFVLLYIFGVIGLTIHLSDLNDYNNEWYFGLCACWLRFITGTTYVRIALHVPEARIHGIYMAIISYLNVIIWSYYLYSPYDNIIMIMTLNCTIQLLQNDLLLIFSPCLFPEDYSIKLAETMEYNEAELHWYDKALIRLNIANPSLNYSIGHINERYGCIILVVLGEMVDGISEHTHNHQSTFYLCAFFGFLCLAGFKMLYFDTETVTNDHHPITRT